MLAEFKNRHVGQRVFILGSGPSIKQQDLSHLKGEVVFCSNWFVNHQDIHELGINYYCAYDSGFVVPEVNTSWRDAIESLSTIDLFVPETWPDVVVGGHQVHRVPYRDDQGLVSTGRFSCNPAEGFLNGQTVVLNLCIPLAIHMGCSEIYLLGCECDYGSVDGGDDAYFYDLEKHVTPFDASTERKIRWQREVLAGYELVAQYCQNNDIRLFNATKGGALEAFSRVEYESLWCGKNAVDVCTMGEVA